jgi:hypothetical protein
MKRKFSSLIRPVLQAAGLGMLIMLAVACARAESSGDVVANRLIVVYRNAVTPGATAMLAPAGVKVAAEVPAWGIAVIQGDAARDPQLRGLQSRLAANPAVAYVVHDRYVSGSRMQAAEPMGEKTEGAAAALPADWLYTSSPRAGQ